MQHSTHTKRPVPPGARLLIVALLVVAPALAGCGGSSSPRVAHLSSTKNASSASSSSSPTGGSSPESTTNPEQQALAYAKCMRSNGVPNFPDPGPGGGTFRVGGGVNPGSPAFRRGQAKCRRLSPVAGITSGPPPSAETLAHYLKVAQCMRRQGVSGFPDPRTPGSVPHNPFGPDISIVSNIEGVIFLFPRVLNQQSPEFTRAAAACEFPLHNH